MSEGGLFSTYSFCSDAAGVAGHFLFFFSVFWVFSCLICCFTMADLHFAFPLNFPMFCFSLKRVDSLPIVKFLSLSLSFW